jgi:hypothetical protein
MNAEEIDKKIVLAMGELKVANANILATTKIVKDIVGQLLASTTSEEIRNGLIDIGADTCRIERSVTVLPKGTVPQSA